MSTRKVKFVMDLDTGQAEKQIDKLSRKRVDGGGGTGGPGGRGGRGMGAAAGGARGGLGGAAKAGIGGALGALAVGTLLPGGFKSLSDAISAATSEFNSFKEAMGANSMARDEVIGTQARDLSISQVSSSLGKFGKMIPDSQLFPYYDHVNRLNRQEIDGARSIRERLHYRSQGGFGRGVIDLSTAITDGLGVNR